VKVRKRPVEVEAMLWDGTEEGSIPIIHWAGTFGTVITYEEDIDPDGGEDGEGRYLGTFHLTIRTMEGWMVARPGYWIIKGVENEFYGCEPKIFDKTYESSVDAMVKTGRVLIEHRPHPAGSPYCYCGWRPQLSLNDTDADRGQHMGHQVDMIMARSTS